MKDELIRQLKWAHAIETGAYHAYEGHWRSLKNEHQQERIKGIQKDEWFHRQSVGFMLADLDSEPSAHLDAMLWVIGKTISFSCYVIGYRAAMWGAKIMEILGSRVYYKLAQAARDTGKWMLVGEFLFMAEQEEQHEEFFKNCLR